MQPDSVAPLPGRVARSLPVDAAAATPSGPGLVVDEHGDGTFAVSAPRAETVDLCVREDGVERRHRLRHVDGDLHWDVVRGMVPGTHYGLRADGEWDPAAGLFANPHKLLQDPYARGVSHASRLLPGFFPYEVDAALAPRGPVPRPSAVDDGDEAVWSVVVSDAFDWQDDLRPMVDWDATVLYELHVKGFTQQHPAVPAAQRGTYAGLGHPAVTDHLRELGVTTVELLPIQAGMEEPHLARKGMRNYWGYSTMAFLAPEPSYATAEAQRAGAQAVLDEVKTMVRTLHAAGLEVILDVVYNHTAEGGAEGPSLSLRGLDGRAYYWWDRGGYHDVTGTGGTLDPRSVHVLDLVLASLRYWVQEVHVDGFRFDLAAALGRDDHGFRPDHPLLRAIATDPVLRGVKLVAEPWDVGPGGWQTGNFRAPFAEWNDAFRDTVRRFWLADRGHRERTGERATGGVRELATRLAGSRDLFTGQDPHDLPAGRSLRAPWASVNYVTAHDGFTLADLTAYDHKHNEANGEDNRDGTTDNRSWNHGQEGGPDPADRSPAAQDLRARRRATARSVLATLLLASGTPLLTAGDERGRSQQGNNNAYCQDSELSWVDWTPSAGAESLRETVRRLTALRREFPQLRSAHFLRPADPAALAPDQVAWFGAEGRELDHGEWMDPARHLLAMLRPGAPGSAPGHPGDPAAAEHLLVVLSAEPEPVTVRLPDAPWPQGVVRVLLDTSREDPDELPESSGTRTSVVVAPGSVVVLGITGTTGPAQRLS